MSKQIINKRDVPRGNYTYTVAQTGWTGEAHVFHLLVGNVRQHMAANAITPPNDLENVIEQDYCSRKPEYCRDTEMLHVNGEDAFTQVVAALAIPAADALAALSSLFGIHCQACNRRHRIIRQLKQIGVTETVKRLKGTF